LETPSPIADGVAHVPPFRPEAPQVSASGLLSRRQTVRRRAEGVAATRHFIPSARTASAVTRCFFA